MLLRRRHPRGPAGARHQPARARSSTRRSWTAPPLLTAHAAGLLAAGVWEPSRGRQPARRRRAVLRRLRDAPTAVDGGRRAGAAVLRRAAAGPGLDRRRCPTAPTRAGGRGCGAARRRRSHKRTRDEWAEVFAGSDACVAPVLAAGPRRPQHPHLAARETYARWAGVTQPAPAPRFSRTPGALDAPGGRPASTPATPWRTGAWTRARIARLLDGGVARQAP